MFYEWLKTLNEADESAWPEMLNAINPSSLRTGYARSHRDDHTARVVAADFLDELSRAEEAALLRDQSKHVYRHDGKIQDAHALSQQFHDARPHHRGPSLTSRPHINDILNDDDRQYLITALWAENDENEEPFDDNYNLTDIHPSTLAAMVSDWRSFRDHAVSLGILGDDPEGYAPHDFWLSRNGHGAGFFDRPEYYGEEQSDALQELAKRYGEYDLVVADDAMIHGGTYHVPPPPKPKPPRKRKKK